MRSSSNFLPSLTHQTPRNNLITNADNVIISPHMHDAHSHDTNVKLENRVFYVEKATARLIHAFESIGTRLTKLESDTNNNNTNVVALSKAINGLKDCNKDFISKQHVITQRLVSDIHKTTNQLTQQTSFMNKEVSDIRDSMQILSTNLQKNYNETIKAAMQQCTELNIQNSNSITSLRKITDQKISHLQQLIVDSQKRAQSQNSSILDIINSNQKNQSEFQNSFKTFFEKFRDSMHQNLSALQESSQEQISYLDNVLRAEVKTRMKNTQTLNKEIDDKLFKIKEVMNQNKRDAQRKCEYITKDVESVKETQKHQQTSTQPLHQMINNLTNQFDETSQQHLTDIKSIMQLNQDTSEKQFNQIKALQIQIQQIWSKVQTHHQSTDPHMSSPQQHLGSIASPNGGNPYMLRPQSYKSDMSSTAAFTAIKQHLANMPGKPNGPTNAHPVMYNQHSEYIQDDNNNNNEPMEAAISEFQELSVNNSPMPSRPERAPVAPRAEVKTETEIETQVTEELSVTVQNSNDDKAKDVEYEVEEYGDEYDDEYQNDEPQNNIDNNEEDIIESKSEAVIVENNSDESTTENIVEKESEVTQMESNADAVGYDEDIDNMLGDDDAVEDNNLDDTNGDEQEVSDVDVVKSSQLQEDNAYDDDNDMEDIDDILGNDDKSNEENSVVSNAKPSQSDHYSEEYGDDNNEKNAEEERQKDSDIQQTTENTENTLERQEKEQSELNDNEMEDANNNNENDQYSDF